MTDKPDTSPEAESHRRTEWSEDRTLMASERTFNSALGTALGCLGVAIGLHAVFGTLEPTWAPKAVASLFLALSLLLVWSARARAVATRQRLSEHSARVEDRHSFTMISAAVTLGALATGAILWLI